MYLREGIRCKTASRKRPPTLERALMPFPETSFPSVRLSYRVTYHSDCYPACVGNTILHLPHRLGVALIRMKSDLQLLKQKSQRNLFTHHGKSNFYSASRNMSSLSLFL